MQNTFLIPVFETLQPQELTALRKWLNSPFFNRREDVMQLFESLVQAKKKGNLSNLNKPELWRNIFQDIPYDADTLNHLFSFLLSQIEHFLAYQEWTTEEHSTDLMLCRALRKRECTDHFERQAQRLGKALEQSVYRNGSYEWVQYQLQNEIFSSRIVHRRGGLPEASAAGAALGRFFMLENLRWACTFQSLQSLGSQALELPPLTDAVLAYADLVPDESHPPLSLLRYSFQAVSGLSSTEEFARLLPLLKTYIHLFPAEESRDIFMSAINFCIKRHNRGEAEYTRAAFNLYRDALERNILTDNGILATYTFNNIFMLACLTGETTWALQFLDQYQVLLSPEDRDSALRYNRAVFHFRQKDYGKVLDLLREVEFNNVFISLDVRKMLLQSYFELDEMAALSSLLDSFTIFIQRQKGLGYHRQSYLNLIRFTKKLINLAALPRPRRALLMQKIETEQFVAERSWLLSKIR